VAGPAAGTGFEGPAVAKLVDPAVEGIKLFSTPPLNNFEQNLLV